MQQIKVNWQLLGGMGGAYLPAILLTLLFELIGINLFA